MIRLSLKISQKQKQKNSKHLGQQIWLLKQVGAHIDAHQNVYRALAERYYYVTFVFTFLF